MSRQCVAKIHVVFENGWAQYSVDSLGPTNVQHVAMTFVRLELHP